jgi:hypothetical protein
LEDGVDKDEIITFTTKIRLIIHNMMVSGKGTRDLCGPSGLTTEAVSVSSASLVAHR